MSVNTLEKPVYQATTVIRCPECGDQLHPMSNFCPRCFVQVFPDPALSEDFREIEKPAAVDCFIVTGNGPAAPIFAQPDINSRRLFIMTGKDLVRIDREEGFFYAITTQSGIEGYVLRDMGVKVRVGIEEVKPEQAWGYYRVNEYLLGWKNSSLPYRIKDAPIKLIPNFKAIDLARIKSDVALPIVGETYGWFEVQLPSWFRGWVPEAFGYRMLRSDSLPEVPKPLSAAEVLAGIAGIAGVITLAGVGAAVSALADD
jgi:hypothetical protein